MVTEAAYSRFIEHLREWYMGLPEAEVLLPLLKTRFTLEEAEFLADFPFLPHSLEDLALRFQRPIRELKSKLEALAEKGLIFERESRKTIRYSLNDSMFFLYRSPFWSGKADENLEELARLTNQYFDQGYGQEFGAYPTMGLRAIPIQRTVKDTRQILPYEDIVRVVEQEDCFCTSHCPCRQRNKLDSEAQTCRHETFNCLHFGRLARYMIKQGMGREISREQTMEILKEAAEAGLVHGISNTREGMDTICNCCSCCCLFLESKHKLQLYGHQPSNYILEIDPRTCQACGLCVKRCPMKALELVPSQKARNKLGKVSTLKEGQCIGCGVCVYKCPTQSLGLVRRSEEQDFPKNFREQVYRMGKERGRLLF
jgi:electron transport complex protein RnfB